MKIAFPYPAYWPYVRRGVERCTHDLATYLASRGHEVHVITSTPGRPRVGWDGKIRVTYLKQLNHPLVYGHGITNWGGDVFAWFLDPHADHEQVDDHRDLRDG